MSSYELLEFIGMLSELIGTLGIAYAALAVHHRFKNEHRVDDKVIESMDAEMKIAFIGVFLIIFGFSAQVMARFF